MCPIQLQKVNYSALWLRCPIQASDGFLSLANCLCSSTKCISTGLWLNLCSDLFVHNENYLITIKSNQTGNEQVMNNLPRRPGKFQLDARLPNYDLCSTDNSGEPAAPTRLTAPPAAEVTLYYQFISHH